MGEQASATKVAFVEELTRFHSERGTTLKIPKFNRSPLDLEKLWHQVRKSGGSSKVCEMKHWAQIGRIFGGTTADKNVSNNIKRAFTKWLLPYERKFYPGEAMSIGEQGIAAPRRKRSHTPPDNAYEKKSRSSTFKKEEKNEGSPKTTATDLEPSLPAVMSIAQSSAPTSDITETQRSYVSIPHTSDSRYCIILLPTSAPQELNANGETGMQMEVDSSQQVCDPCHGSTGTPSQAIHLKSEPTTPQDSQAPAATGQLTLSLLLNHNKDSSHSPSEVQQILSNFPVLLKQDAQNDNVSTNDPQGSVPSVGAQEMSEEGGCEGQAPRTGVPCSGLLCLIENGNTEEGAPQRGDIEDSAIIAPKTT